jgi:hypothetical protein
MANSTGWKPGRWKVVCDRCGFRFHSDALKEEWTGLMVCSGCWETRHPQDFIKVPLERITPPWTRVEAGDTFDNAPVCTLWTSSPMADIGTADCAIVGGNTNLDLLYDTFFVTAIAGMAVSGFAVSGTANFKV